MMDHSAYVDMILKGAPCKTFEIVARPEPKPGMPRPATPLLAQWHEEGLRCFVGVTKNKARALIRQKRAVASVDAEVILEGL